MMVANGDHKIVWIHAWKQEERIINYLPELLFAAAFVGSAKEIKILTKN
jgi:hypothetical protein